MAISNSLEKSYALSLLPRTGMTGCHEQSHNRLEDQAWLGFLRQLRVWLGMLPH